LRVSDLAFGREFTSIPLFQHEVITVHGWLTSRTILDGIALGQITSAPVLITATFIGYRLLGVTGALVGSLAIFTQEPLPSFSSTISMSECGSYSGFTP